MYSTLTYLELATLFIKLYSGVVKAKDALTGGDCYRALREVGDEMDHRDNIHGDPEITLSLERMTDGASNNPA